MTSGILISMLILNASAFHMATIRRPNGFFRILLLLLLFFIHVYYSNISETAACDRFTILSKVGSKEINVFTLSMAAGV